MPESDEEDLARRIEELEEALRHLQADLEDEQRGGFPRPPRPAEILRITDQHAIPVAIAILEAHIHALKFIQGLIRVSGAGASTEEHAERLGRSAVQRLDRLVSDLRSTPMPADGEARELLEQAEQIRADIATRVEDTDASRDGSDTSIDIDVDDELEAIKSDVEDDDQSSGENR